MGYSLRKNTFLWEKQILSYAYHVEERVKFFFKQALMQHRSTEYRFL